MALPLLYSFRRCPYAMRARMALLVSGTACEIREVVLADKPAGLIAASPKATVPVLVLPDGAVIDESLDIMRWALARHDPENWLEAGDGMALVALCDDGFKRRLDGYKYGDRSAEDYLTHRDAAAGMLGAFEARLAHRSNLIRETRSLCDIAVMPFVRQFAAVDRAWFATLPVPRLRAWLSRHVASDLFEAAMRRPARN